MQQGSQILEVRSSSQTDSTVLHISGRADSANADKLEKSVSDVVSGSHKRVVLNLSDLLYISSAGLRVFVIAAQDLRAREHACAGGAHRQRARRFDRRRVYQPF